MKRYLLLALVMHAGAIALAFHQYRVSNLQGTLQPYAMQSEVAVQQSEEIARLDSPAEQSSMPNPETVRPTEVDTPREVLLPPREPKPEPQPPARNEPAPEGALPELQRHQPPGTFARPSPPEPTQAASTETPSPVITSADETRPVNERPSFDDVPGADKPPRLLNRNWPNLIREGFQGQVLVGVVVAPEGHAISVKVIEGTGNGKWDRMLKDLFQYSAYAPGRTNGQSVICSHKFRITFRKK